MELTSREWVDMGGFAWDNEAWQGAIECYTNALNIDPTLYMAWLYRGLVRTQLGEFGIAVEDFKEGIIQCDDPKDHEILYLAKAFSELQLKRIDDFYDSLKMAIADEKWRYERLSANPFFNQWMAMNPDFATFVEFEAYQAIMRHRAKSA